MKRQLLVLSLAGLVASLALAKPSQADTISFTSATVPDQAIPFSQTLTVPQFNPSLGTLTGVVLSVDAHVTASIVVINTTGSAITFTNATASVPVISTGPGGITATTTATATQATGTVAANSTGTFPGVTGISQGLATVPTADFGLYTGTGTFSGTLGVTALNGTFSGTGPTGVFFGGSVTAGGNIDVTYTFTPAVVPEPTSMALLGIGMVSLLSWRRIFKRYTTA